MAIRYAPKAPEIVSLPPTPTKPSRKGIGGRPKKSDAKEQVSLRLDPAVLAFYRALGDGWQSRVNDDLRNAAGLSSILHPPA